MKLPKLPPPDPSKPQTKFEKIMSTTPIALTVIATVLAGLSSSSMNLGQYYRGLATQSQSKAGDQWNLFQAKKLRQSGIDNTTMILKSTSTSNNGAFDLKALGTLPQDLNDEHVAAALQTGAVPAVQEAPIASASVVAALKAIETHQPEEKIKELSKSINEEELQDAMNVADRNYAVFDSQISSINSALDRLGAMVEKHPEMNTPFSLARLRFSSKRYGQDAKYNQTPGELYEIEVRRDSILADRYRIRSKQFFWAMLAAQAGVMAATFSITMRQKSLLWSAATALGLFALSFAAYVYVFV